MTPVPSERTAPHDGLAFAFSPVHKAALGVAVGLVAGLMLSGLTVLHVLVPSPDAPNLGLLAQYFYGYHVTWAGAVVGLGWGLVTGFVVGWFLAFLRNLAVSITVFALRTKADLAHTADFLDHI